MSTSVIEYSVGSISRGSYFKSRNNCNRQSWGDSQPYEAAKEETFSTANVVVDDAKPNSMTTRTHAECGGPGEFIQIPLEYVTGRITDVIRKYGHPGMMVKS